MTSNSNIIETVNLLLTVILCVIYAFFKYKNRNNNKILTELIETSISQSRSYSRDYSQSYSQPISNNDQDDPHNYIQND